MLFGFGDAWPADGAVVQAIDDMVHRTACLQPSIVYAVLLKLEFSQSTEYCQSVTERLYGVFFH